MKRLGGEGIDIEYPYFHEPNYIMKNRFKIGCFFLYEHTSAKNYNIQQKNMHLLTEI